MNTQGMQSPARRPAPNPAPARSATASMTPKEILGILRRRVWLIIIMTVLGAGMGVAGHYVVRRYWPKYTSTGLIKVRMPGTPNLLTPGTTVVQPGVIKLQTESRAQQLRSQNFLNEVLGRPEVRATEWYQARRDDPVKLLRDLQKSFSAAPGRESEFVIVSFSGKNPDEARTMLNEILSEFTNLMTGQATGALRERLKALNDQRRILEGQMRDKRDTLNMLAQNANEPGWGQGQTLVMGQLNTLRTEMLRLEYQLTQARLRYQQLQSSTQDGQISTAVQMAVDQDQLVLGYRSRISGLEEELDRLLERFGENHAEVAEIRTRIQSNQDRMAEREAMLQEQYTVAEMMGAEREVQALEDQLLDITEDHQAAAERQSDLDEKYRAYMAVQADIEQLTSALARFSDNIDAVNTAINDPERVQAEVAQHASLPREISSPLRRTYYPGGAFLGLLFSIGICFLLEFADDSVKSPLDVNRHLRVPNLGMIPEYDEEDAETIAMGKVMAIHPHAIISEFYRQTKTNVAFSAPAEDLKTILVTSCAAGCGKTTTAANLAIAFASDGERVLLIDANFRRPGIKPLFGSAARKGLSDILVGQATKDDAVYASDVERLDVLECGPLPPNPANLLNSPPMKQLLADAREKYDRIFIDGPPALVVSDARVLAAQVNGVIVAIHAGETGRGVVLRLMRELREAQARILGVVLNGVRARRGGYFRKAYQDYNEYVGAAAMATVTPPSQTDAGGTS